MFCINLWLLIISPIVFIDASLVHIDQGTLNGTILKSRNGNEFYGFYGIPYAQPPIGALRFQGPKLPPPSWSGTRNATQKPSFCPQTSTWFAKGYIGSEDCLYLQVFTQNLNPAKDSELKPVLVYFHGGAFFGGGSDLYTAKLFMDKPIVMVMVNSRLGIFGFFSTGEPDYPGNYGLKDQTAALQWIQKNIRAFGGNPSAVTILGQSSGAASVHLHTFSPLSKGLFHGAIFQSGTALYLWSYSTTKRAQNVFQDFKRHSHCARPSTKESVACLIALPAEKLTEFAASYRGYDSNPFKMHPVIEPPGVPEAFLSTDPLEFAYPNPKIPFLVGYTSNEQLGLFVHHKLNASDEKTFDVLLSQELNYASSSNLEWARNVTSLIKKLYFGNNFANCNYKTATELLSDVRFKLGILDTIKTYPGQIYAYEYDFKNLSLPTQDLGVGHSAELNVLLHDGKLNDAERNLSETMITYWTNFVITGDPNAPDKKLPTEWIPAKNNSTDDYLRIIHITNNGFQMKTERPDEKIQFWRYYNENRNKL